ncbi:hypothetical protein ZYGR_0AS05310 [Zygosaccharomyces rouxii]|uniref:Mannan endo-1,6-alpha-mannosidase n=1 Tax=Zygosaccharomyces rouxii TaxID=4956 RepID=A0A1Q3AHJ8_ZYGRO|nr:hypothetical protein ZYGR_0AS05310 [Zygosaccharomyces rouxii]
MLIYNILIWLVLSLSPTWGMDLQVGDKDSVCSATSLIQQGMLDYYAGEKYGGAIGMFQPPYYWWQAGEAFGGMIDNWYFCENKTFEDLIQKAMLAQAGPHYDYMPQNQTMVEGNDDQGVWALTVMGAVERNFTDPGDGKPGWLAMAQAIFNEINERWDDKSCGGGVRWQIFTWNSGYNYKNTISNGCFFQLAARLGRYTNNQTYLEVAEKVFDWLTDVGFVVLKDKGNVFDGAEIDGNCSQVTKLEWTYNHGIILGGLAYMYNATNGSSKWEKRVSQILGGASEYFFQNDVMYESGCQHGDNSNCNNDQRTFKSIFSRMLGLTSVLVPPVSDQVDKLLNTSAEAAAKSCSGGIDGHTCGLDWFKGSWDNQYGLGEQMSALEVIQNTLIHNFDPPYKESTGGSSKGDAAAGLNTTTTNVLQKKLQIKSKDRAGAAIITGVVLMVVIGGSVWMLF